MTPFNGSEWELMFKYIGVAVLCVLISVRVQKYWLQVCSALTPWADFLSHGRWSSCVMSVSQHAVPLHGQQGHHLCGVWALLGDKIMPVFKQGLSEDEKWCNEEMSDSSLYNPSDRLLCAWTEAASQPDLIDRSIGGVYIINTWI